MELLAIVITLLLVSSLQICTCDNDAKQICFRNFQFGVATSSYQIEGAWNVSDKGESIWDRLTHEHPEYISDHSSGDVADDSYHKYEDDVRLLVELGVQFYRFSISWPRILPNGLENTVSEDGVLYYTNLIDLLHKNNIEPLVTMYHWDLPQRLQDLGGWTNPLMADYFVDYARVLFENYGQKVVKWVTFNEPWSFCQLAYQSTYAPRHNDSGVANYLCGHTVLRAHGMVYRMYENDFKNLQNGSVGIAIAYPWFESFDNSTDNQEAAEVVRQFAFGWFAHPIFSQTGDYPPIMRKRIDKLSRQQNFSRSRLPTFTAQEIDLIRGSADFLGINHYTTYLVTKIGNEIPPQPIYSFDSGGIISQPEDWPKTIADWLKIMPGGLRKCVNWIKNTYDNPPVIITENGVPLLAGLEDVQRVKFIEDYLGSLHAAIFKDQCDVRAYSYWSLIDNFEWLSGYSERFGLYEVDFDSPNRTRRRRLSAAYYAQIAKTSCIPNSSNFTL